MPALSPPELEISAPSTEEIRAAAKEAADAVDLAMGSVGVAIQKVVHVGKLLLTKKGELDHGEWMPWIEANMDQSYHTVRNWMKLAELAERKGVDLDNAQSVRQAYIMAGLLPEPGGVGGGSGNGQVFAWLAPITRGERTILSAIAKRPLNQWPDQELKALREGLRPYHELFLKVQEA